MLILLGLEYHLKHVDVFGKFPFELYTPLSCTIKHLDHETETTLSFVSSNIFREKFDCLLL